MDLSAIHRGDGVNRVTQSKFSKLTISPLSLTSTKFLCRQVPVALGCVTSVSALWSARDGVRDWSTGDRAEGCDVPFDEVRSGLLAFN